MICSELIPKIVLLKNIHRLLQSPICFWPVILLMCPGRKISSNGNTPATVPSSHHTPVLVSSSPLHPSIAPSLMDLMASSILHSNIQPLLLQPCTPSASYSCVCVRACLPACMCVCMHVVSFCVCANELMRCICVCPAGTMRVINSV